MGAVYVFRRSLGDWTQEAKLASSVGMAGDDFGWVVSLGADALAVGAPLDDGAAGNAGVAYVFAHTPACTDGVDNDGDGLSDVASDLGCASSTDPSERSPLLACDDGRDQDADGDVDYPADPGCFHPTGHTEAPACNDDADNDGDGDVDLADAACRGRSWWWSESTRRFRCGLGFELALLLPGLMWLRRRRRTAAA